MAERTATRVDTKRLAKKTKAKIVEARIEESPSDRLRSLVKFAGGKSWVLDRHAHLLPKPELTRVVHEPFVGGGAVIGSYIGKAPVVINDKNKKLMAVYEAVMLHPEELLSALGRMVYDEKLYYEARRMFNEAWAEADLVTRAAWFIYLNRTGYNGLYRENQSGGFNVPFGAYTNPTICDPETIRGWSERLRASAGLLAAIDQDPSLTSLDFEASFERVARGDFVFLDPPYVPVNTTTAKFTEYQAGGFTMADQERLAACLPKLDKKGARFLFTNAGVARHLYEGWNIKEVKVARAINSKAKKRGKVAEIFVANYPLTDPGAA